MSTTQKYEAFISGPAMVTIYSRVPENAMSAGLLGTERTGNGIRIRPDGLIVTVGYLVMEADQVWLTSVEGHGSPGYVLAHDYDSGLALIRPTVPLGDKYLTPACRDELAVGESLLISCGTETAPRTCRLIAKQEFAGRWEYLLDEALFTLPACDNWAGAGLMNNNGQLYGIGSLLMEVPVGSRKTEEGNMFIPVDLIAPFIDEMCAYGQRNIPARPWLGTLIQEYEGKLVVVGIYRHCPADRAGIQPGEVVVSVNDEPVTGLAEMFRKVWSLGSAGIEVPLTISGPSGLRRCCVQSIDRTSIYAGHRFRSLN
jgi:S1-C subfamily serine protease